MTGPHDNRLIVHTGESAFGRVRAWVMTDHGVTHVQIGLVNTECDGLARTTKLHEMTLHEFTDMANAIAEEGRRRTEMGFRPHNNRPDSP